MRYLAIKEDLFLCEQPVGAWSPEIKAPAKTNHLWLIDRSGSMYGLLPRLIEDLKKKARSIPFGNTITFGYFSSEGGDFNFPLKGFKVTEDGDYSVLDRVFDANQSALALTCFSEILHDTKTVIKDLSAISPNFSLILFTDGYPVVSNYTREIEQINVAIEAIRGSINSALLVGYGPYFNKQLMSQMAENIGGVMISSRSLHDFSEAADHFLMDSQGAQKKVQVILTRDPKYGFALTIAGRSIVSMTDEDRTVSFAHTGQEQDYVYYLTDWKPAGDPILLNKRFVKLREGLIDAAYAFALALIQRTKTAEALEILGALGDKAFIDRTANTFTNDEYTALEGALTDAVFDPRLRLSEGYDTEYLPRENAFCLIDLMDVLLADEGAHFHPRHPDFAYQRIGKKAVTQPGYPKFIPDQDPRSPINGLTWNKELLNLSVRAKTFGHIQLNGDAAKHGFAEFYSTFKWNNYAVVKDGFLNIPILPVSGVSLETFAVLRSNGIIDIGCEYHPGVTYLLNLRAVNVMNRAMAKGNTSATSLCEKSLAILKIEGELRALNYFKKLRDPEKRSTAAWLTPEAQDFLRANGIGNDGSFSPPTDPTPTTDRYYVKSFEIDGKGLSKFPSPEQVREKLAAVAASAKDKKPKVLTISEKFVAAGIEKASDLLLADPFTVPPDAVTLGVDLLTLKIAIDQLKHDLFNLRSQVQRTKFAILLGNAWFDEFTSRGENKITVDGVEFTIKVRDDVPVEI